MSITQNPAVRAVLSQMVKDPEYKQVAYVPLISWQQIAVIICAYGGIAFGIVGYLKWGFPLWVSYPILIYSMFIGFTPLHDATHKAVSRNPILNDVLGTISAQTLFPGFNTPIYRVLHLEHHRYAGDRDLDPDERLVRWPKLMGPLFLAFLDFHWIYWYLTNAWDRWPRNVRPKFFATVAAIVAIHVIGFSSPYWYEFLILFVIPQRLALAVTGYAFAHIQHPEGLTWKDEPFQSTVRITGNRLKRAILMGQAEHAMHHLLPHVPWFKYHRVYDFANGVLHRQNIPQRGIFVGADGFILPQPASEVNAKTAAQITDVLTLAAGVKQFTIAPDTGTHLEPFDAGAHIEIHLGSGIVRQYSLLNSPTERDRYQIAVKLDSTGRGGSREIHATWQKGSLIEISRPRNNFTLFEKGDHFLLFAGGIGITPLLSMAHRLHELGKPFTLHICARSEEDAPLPNYLSGLPYSSNIEVHIDREDGRSSMNIAQVLADVTAKGLVYVCGPSGFMSWVRAQAETAGWQEEQIHFESFSAPPQADTENHPFDLVLARTGRTIHVAKNVTILDALQHADIAMPFACQQGTCGTCIAHVIGGEIDHRDAYLSELEKADGTQICLCVSRAKGSSLSLDL